MTIPLSSPHRRQLLSAPCSSTFANNQSILDIYVNEIRKTDGRAFNTVIHTYPRIQDPGPRT